MSAKKPTGVYLILGSLSLVLLLSILMLVLSVKEKITIRQGIRHSLIRIKKQTKTEKDPVLKHLADLLSYRMTLQEKYGKLHRALNTRTERSMPVELPDALKFKEQLYETQNRLKDLAKKTNTTLPASFGFSHFETQIPTAEQLPVLVKQLSEVDEIIKLLIKTNIKKINSIELMEPVDKTAPKSDEVIYKEFPVKINAECTTENLIKFLYELRTSEFIFVVRSVKINSAAQEANKIKAEIEINSIILL